MKQLLFHVDVVATLYVRALVAALLLLLRGLGSLVFSMRQTNTLESSSLNTQEFIINHLNARSLLYT